MNGRGRVVPQTWHAIIHGQQSSAWPDNVLRYVSKVLKNCRAFPFSGKALLTPISSVFI
jgi:hypothetical protein